MLYSIYTPDFRRIPSQWFSGQWTGKERNTDADRLIPAPRHSGAKGYL